MDTVIAVIWLLGALALWIGVAEVNRRRANKQATAFRRYEAMQRHPAGKRQEDAADRALCMWTEKANGS